METWVLLAIASLFFAGFQNFGMKVIAKRNYNSAFVVFINYSTAALLSGFYYISNHGFNWFEEGFYLVIIFALLHRVSLYISTVARIAGLKNIDTTLFFPLYKSFFPILMTVVSIFYFSESISIFEGIGIIIGILIPLLLVTKGESSIQMNLKLGLFFVGITTISAAAGSFFSKMLNERSLDIDLFVFSGYLFGVFISLANYHAKKSTDLEKKYTTKGIYFFGIVLGILTLGTHYTYTYALQGNLAIVVTINSFSILIPIILSVIFYKEEMTYKKAFVILLSIVSVVLFI